MFTEPPTRRLRARLPRNPKIGIVTEGRGITVVYIDGPFLFIIIMILVSYNFSKLKEINVSTVHVTL